MSPRARRLALLAALVGLATCNMTDDEVHCEEAASRLTDCCPGFDPAGLDCTAGACSGPRLNVDDGKCIQAKSCEVLVADGTCDRARSAAGIGPAVPDPYPVCR